MPQIPTYQPQVTARTIPYRPFSTEIPRVPDSGIGDTVRRASATVDKVAERIQAEQDDARVTAALTALRRHAIETQNGENGYAKLLGENALTADNEGRGLIERVDTDMHDFGSGLASELTPRQQKLFNEKAQPIYTSSYDGVTQHVFTQGQAYRRNSMEASIAQFVESGAAYAGQPARLRESEAGLREQTGALADMLGLSPDQADVYTRKQVSTLYGNAIDAVLSRAESNPSLAYQALGILNANANRMLGSDVAAARRTIDGYLKEAQQDATVRAFRTREAIRQDSGADAYLVAASGGLLSPKDMNSRMAEMFVKGVVAVGGNVQTNHELQPLDGDQSKNKYGVAKMGVAEAAEVAKAHGIPFDKARFLNDEGYNFALGQYYIDDLYAAYAGDEAKVFAAYRVGRKELDAAVKRAEKAGTPGGWIYELPKDAQDYVAKCQSAMQKADGRKVLDSSGKEMSAFRPGYFAASRQWATWEEAERFVMATDPRAQTDPSYRDATIQKIMGDQSHAKATWVQEQENRLVVLSDAIYAAGGDVSRIPSKVWKGLTFKSQQDAFALAEKVRKGDNSTDYELWSAYMCDDSRMAALSPDQLKLLRGACSDEDWKALSKRYWKIKQTEAQAYDARSTDLQKAGQGQVPADYDVVSSANVDRALEAIDPDWNKFKKDNPQAAQQRLAAVLRAVELGSVESGVPLKGQAAIYEAVAGLSRTMVPIENTFIGSTDRSILTIEPKELPNRGPSDAYQVVEKLAAQELATRGITDRKPTEGELRSAYMKLFFDRTPPFRFSGPMAPEFDDALMQKIVREAPGRSMADYARAYILARLTGVTVPKAPVPQRPADFPNPNYSIKYDPDAGPLSDEGAYW